MIDAEAMKEQIKAQLANQSITIDDIIKDITDEEAEEAKKHNPVIPAGTGTIKVFKSRDEITALAYILSQVTSPVTKTRLGKDGKKEAYSSQEIDNQKLCLHLADRFKTVSVANMNRDEPTLWIWDNEQHIYTKDVGAIHRHITDICRLQNTPRQRSIIAEVMDMLAGTNFYTEPPFNRTHGIPFRNGIVFVHEDSGEITGPHPHTPEAMFTYCLDAVYDPHADTGPVEEVLEKWVSEEDVPILLQHVAIGFIQAQKDMTFKKSLLINGGGNGGKSSFLELNYRAIGKFSGALGGTSLHSIVNDQFALVSLENRLINIFDELDGPELNGWESFKRLTGATLHTIHEKHKPDHRARIYAAHIFACNTPPPVPDRAKYDGAFWNRWSLVEFPYEYQVDPAWQDKTFTPAFLSGYMNLILKTMIEILKTGKLKTNMEPEAVMDRWYQSCDPAIMYLNETFTSEDIYGKPVTKLYHYSKTKMHNGYLEYCNENNIDDRKILKTITKFSQHIQSFGFLPSRTDVIGKPGDKKVKRLQVPSFAAYKTQRDQSSEKYLGASKDDAEQKKVV